MLPGLLNGSQGGLHRVKLKDSSFDPPPNDVTFKKWIDPGFNFTPHLVLEKPGGSQPSLAWKPAGRPQAIATRTFAHDVGVGPREDLETLTTAESRLIYFWWHNGHVSVWESGDLGPSLLEHLSLIGSGPRGLVKF